MFGLDGWPQNFNLRNSFCTGSILAIAKFSSRVIDRLYGILCYKSCLCLEWKIRRWHSGSLDSSTTTPITDSCPSGEDQLQYQWQYQSGTHVDQTRNFVVRVTCLHERRGLTLRVPCGRRKLSTFCQRDCFLWLCTMAVICTCTCGWASYFCHILEKHMCFYTCRFTCR